MPVENYENWYYDAGELLYWVWVYRLNGYQDNFSLGTASLSNRHGFRCFQWSQKKGGTTRNFYQIFLGLAAAELTQARAFMRMPGWNKSIQVGYYSTGQPLFTWALMRTLWQQNYVAYKQALIDNWSTSFISAQTLHEISMAGDRVRCASSSYQITTDSETLVDVSTLQGFNATLLLANAQVEAPAPAVPSGPSNLYLNSPAIESIAESMQDIALTDYEISLNHGQSIFSVRGKVTT